MAEQRVVRFSLGWEYGSQGPVDRGQVVTLEDCPNDEKLIRLGYFEASPLKKSATTFECGECGKQFIDQASRAAHGNLRHPDYELSIEEAHAQWEAEQARQTRVAPLHLENTTASRS